MANLAHQVLACAPFGRDTADLLAGFSGRSRAVRIAGRTGFDAASGWLVTSIGARGQDWGRLILVRGGQPAPGDEALIERAATTLALGRLLDHHRESLERQAHRTILARFLGPGYGDLAEAEARARALGVPVAGRLLVALVVRVDGGGVAAAACADALAEVCRLQQIPALVSSLDEDRVAALLALPPRAEPDAVLNRLASELRPRLHEDHVIGAGSAVDSVSSVQRSLLEADHVAAAVPAGGPRRAYYRLPDLRLRGLLHLLRDDPRLQAFAERELGALLAHDDVASPRLMPALIAYLAAGGNKAEAAKVAHLARPTMYERIRQIEDVLGVSLEPAESRLSLHVALFALGATTPS
jgi:purine catabolism regulator